MEDTVFITRFCFNPVRADRTEVAHETWIGVGTSWRRGAVTVVKQALGGARPARASTTSLDATRAGSRDASRKQLGASLIVDVPCPLDAPREVCWEPAVPRGFATAPPRSTPTRSASELCPFHAMGARTASI